MRRYFAYGSNLDRALMARLCPAARPAEVLCLSGWRFAIAHHGYATLIARPGARVFGQVWALTPECEVALDLFEQVAEDLYRKHEIAVGDAPALVYLVPKDGVGRPNPGYLENILQNAGALGFSDDYRRELSMWADGGFRRE